MSQVYIKELLWRFEQLINGYFYLMSGWDKSKPLTTGIIY